MGFLPESGSLYTSTPPPNRKKSNLQNFFQSPTTPLRRLKTTIYNHHSSTRKPSYHHPPPIKASLFGLKTVCNVCMLGWEWSEPLPPANFLFLRISSGSLPEGRCDVEKKQNACTLIRDKQIALMLIMLNYAKKRYAMKNIGHFGSKLTD